MFVNKLMLLMKYLYSKKYYCNLYYTEVDKTFKSFRYNLLILLMIMNTFILWTGLWDGVDLPSLWIDVCRP